MSRTYRLRHEPASRRTKYVDAQMRHRTSQHRDLLSNRIFGKKIRWSDTEYWHMREIVEKENPPPVSWKGCGKPWLWYWVSPAKGWYRRNANRASRRVNRQIVQERAHLMSHEEWEGFFAIVKDYFTSWDLS